MSCYTYTACLVFITFLYKQHNSIPVLAHQTQCKSHYITTGTEFLPKCYLHYRESLTLEWVIFAQPVLVYIINKFSPLIHLLYIKFAAFMSSWWTNISSYEWVNGTIFQDCFSLHFFSRCWATLQQQSFITENNISLDNAPEHPQSLKDFYTVI